MTNFDARPTALAAEVDAQATKRATMEQFNLLNAAKAEEIAAIVVFLASDGAAFMTGSVVTANGAQYIANG